MVMLNARQSLELDNYITGHYGEDQFDERVFNRVKYIHIREYSEEGDLLPKGGATIAYRMYKMDSVEFAIARCSKKDPYSKRKGRDIALGRLLKSANFIEGGVN